MQLSVRNALSADTGSCRRLLGQCRFHFRFVFHNTYLYITLCNVTIHFGIRNVTKQNKDEDDEKEHKKKESGDQ